MKKHAPSLLVAPRPIADETPASWILRTCQMHQCGISSLFKAFAIRRPVDLDLQLCAKSLAQIAHGTAIPPTDVTRLHKIFTNVRRNKELRSELNFDTNGEPIYRFCAECLSEDAYPYLRVAWRFLVWKICPVHLTEMQDRCPHCRNLLRVNLSNVGFDRATRVPRTCLFCPSCRATLTAAAESTPVNKQARQLVAFQRSFVAACLCGYFKIEGIDKAMSLDLLLYMKRRNLIQAFERQRQGDDMPAARRTYVERMMQYINHQYRHERKFRR